MTETEFEQQEKRVVQYNLLCKRKRELVQYRDKVKNGVKAIICYGEGWQMATYDYPDREFKERFAEYVVNFLDAEISAIDRAMEEI